MYNFPDFITPLLTAAAGAVVGVVGLIVAVVTGIWIDLPSWAYLAAFGGSAVAGGGWAYLWSKGTWR